MRQISCIVLFSILWFNCNGQTKLKIDCGILQKGIELDFFKKRFFIEKYKDNSIVIIDTNYYFNDCQFTSIQGRKIKFQRQHNYSTEKSSGEDSYNAIVISKVEKVRGKYRISFWRPYNNGAMTIEFGERKKRITTKVLEYGSY